MAAAVFTLHTMRYMHECGKRRVSFYMCMYGWQEKRAKRGKIVVGTTLMGELMLCCVLRGKKYGLLIFCCSK